jgi:hypothetical protein
MEGNNLVAFDFLIGDEELSPSLPSARRLHALLVQTLFEIDENIGKLLVGRTPRAEHLLVGRGSQDLLDSSQQVLTYNRIMVGCHPETGMLVSNSRNCGAQCFRMVNVACVCPYGVRQGSELLAGVLMSSIEDVFELGMRYKQALIE